MSIVRHTSYNLAGAAIPIGLALITVPLYLKVVGPDRYGFLAIAWLLLGYFGLFDLGLGRATSYRIAALRDAEGRSRADTFWAALAVNLAMGAVGGILFWAATGYFFAHLFKVSAELRPEIVASVPALAASLPIATITGVLTGALQGREKFFETNVVSVVSTALFQVVPLGFAWAFGPTLQWLLVAALLARFLTLIALGYLCYGALLRGYPFRVVRSEVFALLKYGGWVTLTSVFGPVLVIVDRFVIGAVLGALAVTVYTIPFQLAQRIAIVPTALMTALFPKLSSATSREQQWLGDQATTALASLMTLPVLAALFLLQPFLDLWVGVAMGAQASPIGRILIVGFWANAFALIPYVRLQASGRPDLVTKVLIAEVPPYLALLYFSMVLLGTVGSALTFCVRCIVDCALLTWASGATFGTWPILGANFVLLSLAVYLSGLWPITDWAWWVSFAGLSLPTALLAWRTLPMDLRERLAAQFSAALRGGALG